MLTKLREILFPLVEIARELRALRELYEAELAARVDATGRHTPIYRVTEKPTPWDTTVTYAGEGRPDERTSALENFLAAGLQEADEEEA